MRIKRVFVKKLFGLFDHEINMKMDDRITIIHAPNGFGKTAMLRMIDALFRARYGELRSIPFGVFGVEFEDGRTLTLETQERHRNGKEPKKQRRQKTNERSLVFNLNGHSPFEAPTFSDPSQLPFPVEAIEQIVPALTRIGPAQWQTPVGDVLELDDVLFRFPEMSRYVPREYQREPPWLKEARSAVDVQFIRADRLMSVAQPERTSSREGRSPPSPAVMMYSQELARAIGATLTQYAELSQKLDRSFPVRLVSQSGSEGLTEDEIKERLSEFEAKRSRLTESGLLDRESGPAFQVPPTIDRTKASVLSVYIRDVAEKLSVFDELAEKIELLKGIINRRFGHKRMVVSRDKGIQFKTEAGQPLDPTNLSSGEQHELVMLCELLFKVRRDSLILIDEPEISLHIAWQQEFLEDLSKTVRLSGFDVLIATHSPQIINDRWDLTVELHDTPELQEAAR